MADTVELYRTFEGPTEWQQNIPGVVLTAGIVNRICFTLRDNPISAPDQKFNAVKAVISIRHIPDISKIAGTFDPIELTTDATTLNTELYIPADMPRGYYRLHILLYDATDTPIDVLEVGACVDKSVQPRPDKHMTMESVRTQFRDLSAADNELLDSLEIGTGDIIDAVQRCIEQYNNRAPRIMTYDGTTFPYPEILRTGVLYMLLRSIWTALERRRMSYQAGGVQVDLERRADAYNKLMQEYSSMWSGGISQAKNEENLLTFTGHYTYL